MKYTLPRGTKDILPTEVHFWQYIENTSRSVFQHYNFNEIRTPIFESTDLFERGIGESTDIVEKEMYTFQDKGERRLTLRPEGTAPIVRAYIQNNLHQKSKVSKLYYCGPMFRYERPQAGRYRQFHQIGVECIGSSDPFIDAEVISLGMHLFDELGLTDLTVSINSVGCQVCRPVIEERLKQFLGASLEQLCGDCNRRYNIQPLRILDCKNDNCKKYFTALPDIRDSLCQECHDHFTTVVLYLDTLGIPFRIDSKLVRGLDYYTRTTFEITSDKLGAQNTLCGGGRYNYLVQQLGGPDAQAVGFAFGMERAVLVLKEYADLVLPTQPLIYIAAIGEAYKGKCFSLLDTLRRAGFNCEMDFQKEELKHHLKVADKMNANYTLVYGENEAESKTILLKNMSTGEQKTLSLEHLESTLSDEIK
jgi:histidyl-tRNA synthetase